MPNATLPEPFEYAGGSTGILLLHGYTSAPNEVRPMGAYLRDRGLWVLAPLLPGHGTSPEDLNTRSWQEVAEAAAQALYELQGKCDRVFVSGLSMGGLLALYLAERCGGIAGVIPMAAAVHLRGHKHWMLPIAKRIVPTLAKSTDIHTRIFDATCAPLLWSYPSNPLRFADQVITLMRYVRDRLPRIHQPILAFQGLHDATVPVRAAHTILEKSSSTDTELVLLAHSGHCLCVDGERQQVFAKTYHWIVQRS